MELESVGMGGAAAFREVRVQSVVVEFLLTHVDVLFSDTFTSAGLDPAGMPSHLLRSWLLPTTVRAAEGGQVGSQSHPHPTEAGPPSRLLEDPAPASPSPRPPSFSFQLLRSGFPPLGPDAALPSPLVAPGGAWGHGSTWEEVGGPQT